MSQYDQPLCSGGSVQWFDRQGQDHCVALTRIHLEEDTGKLTHPEGANFSLIDYNRSSIPLLELVTEPVIGSAQEAKLFAEEYQSVLQYLEVAEASMEKGQMRCEANISVIPEEWASDSDRRLSGTKVEVKNLNSFRSLERAIIYEIERQTKVLVSGGRVEQETRGWNESKGETYSMRKKETADDYRYFPEPDLVPLTFGAKVALVQDERPSRYDRHKYLLAKGADPEYVFTVIRSYERFAFLERLCALGLSDEAEKLSVQWLSQAPHLTAFHPEDIKELLGKLLAGELSPAHFKEALLAAEQHTLMEHIAVLRAGAVVDDLHEVVAGVLKDHSDEVARYRAGQVQLVGFFVGQVRQKLGGKGDPRAIAEEIKGQLA